MPTALPPEFYDRPTLCVARELLGARLMRILDGERICGLIVETEAYIGESDLGCHARAGKTLRTQVMYGPPGHAYVYFTYGMHWMLNVVTQSEGFPAAVLIRAVRVEAGLRLAQARRPRASLAELTNGPAKLTQAFAIDQSFNNIDLTSDASPAWIEPGIVISDTNVTIGPRVGLYNVLEPWKSIEWRFLARGAF